MFSDEFIKAAGQAFEKRLPLLGETGVSVKKRISDCPDGVRELLQFYYGFMPLSDAFGYEPDLFYQYAVHAAFLRKNSARCAALPEEVFLHDVAWYRINSERIVDCRRFFYEKTASLIEGLEEERAVLELNYWCASQASYEASDERTQSPLSVYRSGSGRCGEESTFLVSVLRSVGIPARQVYAPRWAHCDDNHAWAEVLVNGEWHFLGACEPEELPDRGWFTNAATRALLVYARTFSDYGIKDRILGQDGCVRFLNVTEHYAKTRPLCIRTEDGEGRPAAGASVSLEILNMAEFFSVLTLVTGEDGTARLSVGRGDLLVRAWKDGLCAEALCGAGEEELILRLTEAPEKAGGGAQGLTEPEIHAPADGPTPWPAPDAAQKERGRARLKEADRQREEKLTGYRSDAEEAGEAYPEEKTLFLRARGNVGALRAFLDGKGRKEERRLLLHTLSDKDLRDADTGILEEQLWHIASLPDRPAGALFSYCLGPRLEKEELTAFAPAVKAFFTEAQLMAFAADPEKIWEWEQENLRYLPEEDYDTLRITPPAALRGLWADERGKRILFAAVCRTLGIPARLSSLTGEAEYWKEGRWRAADGNGRGPVRLILLPEGEGAWNYGQTWTLGRLSGMRYETLNGEGIRPEGGRFALSLPEGDYRLITVNRMPNGNQYVTVRRFRLSEGEEKTLEMKLRKPRMEDMRVKNPLPAFTLTDEAGNKADSRQLLSGRKSLLIFAEEGREPTEHVLNELLAERETMKARGIRLILAAASPASLENPLLKRTVRLLEGTEVYFDEGMENVEPVARRMYVPHELLPLLVAADEEGCGVYACSGYHVGSVGLALRILDGEENS